jgi:RNase H-fold protein (predicted Holliday junction resolvase)
MNGPLRRRIIGIDPGRTKCGMAVVFEDGERVALDVVPAGAIAQRLQARIDEGGISAICVGHATTSDRVVALCRSSWPDIPVAVVDESNTTLQARQRYYRDHPPKGLLRLVPRGLLVPKEPLDGYAALLIVERFLSKTDRQTGSHPPGTNP